MRRWTTVTSLTIKPVHEVLLRGSAATPVGLYHLQLVTADQLTRLHYSPGSLKAVKARLKQLVDAGYVQSDTIPTKMFRAPFYYTLGAKGLKHLSDLGFDREASWRASKEVDKHSMFVEHTLELNDVLIAAMLLNRTDPRFYLEGFIHERTLKRHPYKAHWYNGIAAQTATVIPDAFLDFRYNLPDGSCRRFPVLLEHDRGTEEQHFFRRRIRAYIMLLKSGDYRELFKSRSVTVAFTTFLGKYRVNQMRSWALKELQGEPPGIAKLFYFTLLSRPLVPLATWLEPRWYTAYDNQLPETLLAS
jgi:Replication-relaxation